MKNVLILISLVTFASQVNAATKHFYVKFKGQSDEEALDKVDDAIEGLKNGRYIYRHEPIRILYASKGCEFTKAKYINLEALTVKKAYRVNRHGELEVFKQATVKVAHSRCLRNSND
jgi:hypothetical protein